LYRGDLAFGMTRLEFSLARRLLIVLMGSALLAPLIQAQPTLVVVNQNHSPAGVVRNGVMTIHLEVAQGAWHPEAEDGMSVSVFAFGEVGHVLQNPGPLIRVPQGTEIQATLHNALSVPVVIHGLGSSADAVLHVAPGATESIRFMASTPGLFFYWGATDGEDLKLRYGIDSELTGALVVDPPGADSDDEIFVIEMIWSIPVFDRGRRSRPLMASHGPIRSASTMRLAIKPAGGGSTLPTSRTHFICTGSTITLMPSIEQEKSKGTKATCGRWS
jgi:FtsP/CotA-like multicopper oxidase with cupredoxin domain